MFQLHTVSSEPLIAVSEEHYLLKWLKSMINEGKLTEDHLLYQQLQAHMEIQYKSREQVRWAKYPTILSFCEALRDICDQKVYNLYIGERGLIPSFTSVNHPGPNISKLYRDKPAPNYDGGIHYDVLATLVQLLDKSHSLAFTGSEYSIYPVVNNYDGQPLKQGTFVRSNGDTAVLDGIRPVIELETLQQCDDMIDYVKHKSKFVSEVRETILSDVYGIIALNAATDYCTASTTREEIMTELKQRELDFRKCFGCIIDNINCSLCQDINEKCCKNCKKSGVMCKSIWINYTFSDMLPVQRCAHIGLNRIDSNSDLPKPRYGFAFLHICKSFVSFLRNWWLSNNVDTFNISLLAALLTSSDKENRDFDVRILGYRDRHSDGIAYNTVNKDVQNLLKDAKSITCTVVPDMYRPWSNESKSHQECKAFTPYYIATNQNGEPIWTDGNQHVVFFGNRHNPMKLITIGQVGKKGDATLKQMEAKNAKFSSPAGIAVIRYKEKEYAVVGDTENNCLRLIDNVNSILTIKRVSTLQGHQIRQPLAVSLKAECEIYVSSHTSKSIFLLSVKPLQKNIVCLYNILVPQIHMASGLHFLQQENTLIIANSINLITVKSPMAGGQHVNKVTVFPACKSYGDISQSPTGKIAISDPAKGQVHVFKYENDLIYMDSLGNAESEGSEGRTQLSSFEEPIGLTYVGESLYTCCFGCGLKLTTNTDFAQNYCDMIEKLYYVTDYSSAVAEDKNTVDFQCKIRVCEDVYNFLESLNNSRSDYLGKANVSTRQGVLYPETLKCLKESLESLKGLFTDLHIDNNANDLSIYAFTNEGPVEHTFGHTVQQSQYTVLSLKQYAMQKVGSERDLIRKTCQTPFSYHVTERKQYQKPKKFKINASEVFVVQKEITSKGRKQGPKGLSESVKEKCKELENLNRVFRPQPTQSVREKYKARCGEAPSVITYRHTAKHGDYAEHLQTMHKEYEENHLSPTLQAGDIVGLLAGEVEGSMTCDDWWLLLITRDLNSANPTSRCHIHGNWLEHTDSSDGFEIFRKPSETEIQLYFGNLLMDRVGDPFIIPREECIYERGSYSIPLEVCHELTEQAQKGNEHNTSETNVESENASDDTSDPPSEPQSIDYSTRRRTREINCKGMKFKSYKDLLKH